MGGEVRKPSFVGPIGLGWLFTLAGILAGVLEAAAGISGTEEIAGTTAISTVAFSGAFLGLFGGMVGVTLGVCAELSRRAPVVVLVGLFALVTARYDGIGARSVLVSTLAATLLVARFTRSSSLIASASVSALLLWLLRPLFTGKAMELVFSESQILLIFLLTAPTLIVALWAVLSLLEARALSASSRVVLSSLSLLVAWLLAEASSVFLVRLWGFRSMEYLQCALLGLEISLLALFVRGVVARRIPESRSALLRVSPALAVLLLLASTAFPGSAQRSATQVVLHRMPHSGLLLTHITLFLDRDGDGYPSAFGLGDCDDTRSDVHPAAVDFPGDGVDQNCIGGDLRDPRHPYFNSRVDVAVPLRGDRPRVVIFVTIDTLRADAVQYVTPSATPTLAAIAAQSVRFDQAYAQSNNTLESFPFMLHMGFRNLPLYNEEWTLAHWLRRGGVRSEAVLQLALPEWWADGFHGVMMGFDQTFRPSGEHRTIPARDNALRAVERLRARPADRDLFLMVHFEELHDYATDSMEGGRMIKEGVNVSELVRLLQMDSLVAGMKKRYHSALEKIDLALAPLWNEVREIERDADVMLVVVSDHGEEFHEHGGLFHMGTLYQELVRVPLLVYRTRSTPRIEPMPVGINRLPATMLQFLGYQGEYVRTMDLTAQPVEPFEVFSYFSISEQTERRSFMILHEDLKLVYHPFYGHLELYDLARDPGERRNVIADSRYHAARPALLQKMDRLLFYMNYGDNALVERMRQRRSVSTSRDEDAKR
jgi:arylsulfatase A-like enzyme